MKESRKYVSRRFTERLDTFGRRTRRVISSFRGRVRRSLGKHPFTVSLVFGFLVLVLAASAVQGILNEKADADKNGLVETGDMFDFAAAFREKSAEPDDGLTADLDGDGKLNEQDVFRFLHLWNRDREESLKRLQGVAEDERN